jgi:5-methylcytosine-specific restriction protein A
VVRGNNHHMGNLQAACQPCHAAKSSAEGNAARWQPSQRLVRPAERHPGLR